MPTLDSARIDMGFGGSLRTLILAHANLKAYWPLTEFRGTAISDASGNGEGMTATGSPTFGAYGFLPQGGTAITFDGVDDALIGTSSILSGTGGNFSILALVRTTNLAAAKTIVTTSSGATAPDLLINGNVISFGQNGGGWFISSAAITSAVDYLVMATYDGTNARLYVNGVLVAGPTANAFAGAHGTPQIGRYGAASERFIGQMGHVAVFDAVLSQTDATAFQAARTWTANTDVLAESIEWVYGIRGNTPVDRTADPGHLRFSLRNDNGCSGGVQGYYSPNHASKRSGFTYGIPIRLVLTSGTARTKFWGRLYEIDPEPGQERDRLTHCVAYDFQYVLGDTDVREIPPQIAQTDDSLIYAVLEALPVDVQPMAVSLNAGLDTYAYAFQDIAGGVKAPTAIDKVTMSSWAKQFVKGDGTFCYRNRLSQGLVSTALTLSNDMVRVTVPSTQNNVFDRIRVTHHKFELGSTATEVLYTQPAGDGVVYTAGESKSFFEDYTDPADPARTTNIAGTDFVDPPLSGTDWIANAAIDGSGANRTADFTYDLEPFATTAQVTLTNISGTPAYLTTQKIRGRGIYDRGPVTQESGTGSRPLNIDMPYQNDPNVALAIAAFVGAEYGTNVNQIDEIAISPEVSATFLVAALDVEPGDSINVTETMTGVSMARTLVHGVEGALSKGPWFDVTWTTAPMLVGQAWILDSPTRSQLDSTTILAYG